MLKSLRSTKLEYKGMHKSSKTRDKILKNVTRDEGGLYQRDTYNKVAKTRFYRDGQEFKGVWAARDDNERKVTGNIDGNASTMSVSV